MRRITLVLLLLVIAARTAGAETILIAPPVVPPAPGPEWEDTAVYHFIPSLSRGDYISLYAFSISEDNQSHDFRTFIRFPIPEELAGACVEDARVLVYYTFDASGFGEGENVPATVTCEPVLADWDESTMTWSNQPPIGVPLDTITNITSFRLLAPDVTPLAQSWLDGAPNYGIALSSPTARGLGFKSFEAQWPDPNAPDDPDLRPALVITIADDPQACPEPASAFPMALIALAFQRARRRR